MLADIVNGIPKPKNPILDYSGSTPFNENLNLGKYDLFIIIRPETPRLKASHISARGSATGYKTPPIFRQAVSLIQDEP
jgi:hypothetical protein